MWTTPVFISAKTDGPLHCDKLLDLTVSGLGAVGFQLTQQSRAGELDKVVGYEVVEKPAEFRLPKKKMVLLRAALMHLVNQTGGQHGCVEVAAGNVDLWCTSQEGPPQHTACGLQVPGGA